MKKIRRSIIFATFIYFIDALVYSQGGIAFIVALIAVLGGGTKALIALLKKDKALSKERLIRAGIYIFMAVMVFISVNLNNRLAVHRANQLIKACNSYYTKHQSYPDKLEDLAPDFITEVPLAKYSLLYNNFIYISGEGRHLLAYYLMPPFGRRIYNLEKGHWGYLD